MKQLSKLCFEGIPTDAPVIVAVSGGSDSMALLLLANAWAVKQNVELHVVTIDHGLRPEAAAEAAYVASVCAGLNRSHVTLIWEGQKPVLGIQNAARQSRYALLDQFAHEIGSNIILTGHNLDDQAETVYMRMQRHLENSDGKGLAGMARTTWLYGGTRIFRPLLGCSRQTLRNVLNDFSQGWIEDPSNLDESYERVVVRKHLNKNPELAVRILALAKTCSEFRFIEARDCAAFLEQYAVFRLGGVFDLNLDFTVDINHPVLLNAIQVLIAITGGQEYFVPRKRVKPVFNELIGHVKSRVTIGGAVIEKTKTGFRFFRERRNLTPLVLEPGEIAIWDGRLYVHNETPKTVFIEAAKRELITKIETERGAKFDVQPRQALWSSPVFHLQKSEVEMSSGKSRKSDAICLPLVDTTQLPNGLHLRLASPAIEHFCPQFDGPIRDWLLSLDRHISASIAPKA